jgi:hypothetical protein
MDSGFMQNFSRLIRNWLHYDTLTQNLWKQTQNARKVKKEYEEQIIQNMKNTHIDKSIIQIDGGTLQITDEKNPSCLTLGKIQELINKYYQQKGGKNETRELMMFIRMNRGYDIKTSLRKSNTTPSSSMQPQQLTNQ